MRGFDNDFRDLPDYILKITESIWEGRRPDLIHRYYSNDCVVRSPGRTVVGSSAVVATTLEMLHEFPDRRLLGEDVIWAGDDETGYFSSHRILSTMRHLGDGSFGVATGKPVRARTIADCAVSENRIYEEWMVRDRAAMAIQIGLQPRELAQQLLSQSVNEGEPPPLNRYTPKIETAEAATGYADSWRTVWSDRRLSVLLDTRHRAVALELPGGETASGVEALDRFAIGYLASFPDCDFTVDHLVLRRDSGLPVRVAMRWTSRGTHIGHGRFGPPSGAPVEITGINHAHLLDSKVIAEWILIDDVAVWQQILSSGHQEFQTRSA